MNNLKKVPEALSGIRAVGNDDADAIKRLVGVLKPLSEMGSISNFTAALNKLRQLPEVSKTLESMDMTRFEQQIIRVTNAVRPLATEMDKIARGFGSFPERIQRVIAGMEKLEGKSDTLSGATGKINASFRSMQNTFTTLYYGITRITDKLGEWFDESAEYVEALNLFNVTMRDGTDAAFAYAESVSELMGIDIKEWMNYQGAFQNLVTGYEVATDKARTMSKGLTQLAYDLSSVYNVSVETAFTKLQSAMSGQVKSLKVWGVDVSVASMKQYLLAKGIEASWLSLNTAQKAVLRYNYIMEKTIHMQGDLARTLVTPSNAMRIFGAQCVQLWRALGNIVAILATKVIPYMQAFVEEATDAANKLAVLWGFELPKIDYSGLDSTGVTDDISETEEALVSLKRSCLGMDEINILGKNATVSGGSLPGDMGLDIYDYNFLANTVKITDEIREKVRGFVTFLKDAVTFTYENGKLILGIVTAIVAVKIGKDLFNLLGALGSVVKLIGSGGAKIITGAMLSFTTAFEATGSVGSGVAQIFKDCGKNLKSFYNGIPTAVKQLIGVAGLAAGFSLCKNGAYELTKAIGSNSGEGLGKAMLSLVSGGAMAIAGGAMIGGPVGALIGGIIALGGALIGVAQANEDLRKEMNDSVFFDDYGVSIASVTDGMKKTFSDIDLYTSKQKELQSQLENAGLSAIEAKGKLESLFCYLDNRNDISADDIAALKEGFDDLYRAVDTMNTARFETVANNISQAIIRGLSPAETKLASLQTQFLELQSKLKIDYTNLSTEASSIIEALGSGSLDDSTTAQYKARLKEIEGEMAVYSYQVDPSDIQREAAYGRIDIGGNVGEALSNLQNIRNSVDTRVSDIDATKARNIADMESMRYIAEQRGVDTGVDWDAAKELTDTNASAQMKTVIDGYAEVLNRIGAELSDRTNAVISKQLEDWENANSVFDENWWTKPINPVDWYGQAYQKAMTQFGSLWDEWRSEAKWLSTLAETYNVAPNIVYPPISQYATGGFPEDGLFMANSRELVGKFTNGKTAVVNNNQIIEGIKQGVKEANSESTSAGGDWIIQLVDTDGNLKSETIITAAERKNRRDGKTIIPVGT